MNSWQHFLSGIDGSLNISNIILMICCAMNCVRSDILYQHLHLCVVSLKWANENMVWTDWNFNLCAWEWICIKLVIYKKSKKWSDLITYIEFNLHVLRTKKERKWTEQDKLSTRHHGVWSHMEKVVKSRIARTHARKSILWAA